MRTVIILALVATSCSEDAEPAIAQPDTSTPEVAADAETTDAETSDAASCTPGQTECRDRGIWYCDQSAAWTLGSTCETACINAACTKCRPGVVDCVGGDVVVCDANGNYATLKTCDALCVDGGCCTPSCGERACGPDGCGGTCGAECREGAACDGLVCADIACGADPSRDCIVEQCAGIGLPLLLQSSEFYAGCWGAVREEYIRNGCPSGSLHDFYCGTDLCEKFPNSSCY